MQWYRREYRVMPGIVNVMITNITLGHFYPRENEGASIINENQPQSQSENLI